MLDALLRYWWAFALFALIAVGFAFFVSRDAQVARRIFLQFFGNIVAPLAVIFGLVLFGLALVFDFDERVWAAVIAGLVIASGWLTSAIFAELGKSRGRAERTRDYHKALYAEIGNAVQNLYDEGRWEEAERDILGRMEGDPDFVPFVPKEHHDYIFDAIVDDIEVLPRQTIDAIVAYYSVVKGIAALAEDMRGEAFRGLPQPRRIAIYSDYLAMRKQAYGYGLYAIRLIRAYSEGGSVAAEAEAADEAKRQEARAEAASAPVSSPDADPSGQSRGSE